MKNSNKAMAAATKPGDTRSIGLEKDKGTEPEIPPELKAALKAYKEAATKFDAFPPACRREYANWIASARREETRVDRSMKAVKMMLAGKMRPSK
jgi:uncharacterized protein YdeI (YjbR/CyaY-like superfamily)